MFKMKGLCRCIRHLSAAVTATATATRSLTFTRGSNFLVFLAVMLACSCGIIVPQQLDEYVDGRLRVTYWEVWTGFEGEAIQRVVDRFNGMQDKVYVDLTTVSQIDRKALIAIAGGDPPDLLGLWSGVLAQFAEKRALTCLDPFIERAGMNPFDFIDVFIEINSYRGKVYALPTTPATTALHWNKSLFEAAGLDPEAPPRTLDELDRMADQLTKFDENGNLVQLGFTPAVPAAWPWAWGAWFGAELWAEDTGITFDTAANLQAYKWIEGYSAKYGADKLRTFQSGFGNFSSPQNPFLSDKLAMVMQGVWMHNFIDRYAPDMRWGAAPFPSAVPGLENVSIAESNSICIPAGARHPDEAFEFIQYLCSQDGLEMLNMGQRKFSPLKRVSPEFIQTHPNPYIGLFIDLAGSPNVCFAPQTSVWYEYLDEIGPAFDLVRFGKVLPEKILPRVQQRASAKWRRQKRRMARRAETERGGTL